MFFEKAIFKIEKLQRHALEMFFKLLAGDLVISVDRLSDLKIRHPERPVSNEQGLGVDGEPGEQLLEINLSPNRS